MNLKPDCLEVLDNWHCQAKPAPQIMCAKRKSKQSYKFFKSKQKKQEKLLRSGSGFCCWGHEIKDKRA